MLSINTKSKYSFLLVLLLIGQFVYSQTPVNQTKEPDEYIEIGKDVIVSGIPPLPKSILEKYDYYNANVGNEILGFKPNSDSLWFLGAGVESPAILRRDKPLGNKTEDASLPFSYYDAYPSPDGNYFAYTADESRKELYQLYLVKTGEKKALQLTDGKSRNVEPLWSKDNKQIVYGTTPPGFLGMQLAVLSISNPEKKKVIASSQTTLQSADWSSDNQRIVYVEELSNYSNQLLWQYDFQTGKRQLLTPKSQVGASMYSSPKYSADGNGLYLISNAASEFAELCYLDLNNLKLKRISNSVPADIDEFEISPDGKKIVFVSNENSISKLYLYDINKQAISKLEWAKEGVIARLRWKQDSSQIAFRFEWYQSKGDVYSYDLKTKQSTLWAKAFSFGFPIDKYTKPELIQWKSFDGLNIQGLLYRPPSNFMGKRPVLIDLHGGPESQARPILDDDLEYFIRELGIAVIRPNVRGSTGYGKTFLSLDNGVKREDATKDVGALLDWIASQPELDSQKVMVNGASYGGYLALTVAAKYSERLRGAISLAGMTNLVSFLRGTAGWRKSHRRGEYGDERNPKIRIALENASPLKNASKIKIPLLLTYGAKDPRVPLNEATQLANAVRTNRTPVWQITIMNEGHDLLSDFDVQSAATVLFVKKYLLN